MTKRRMIVLAYKHPRYDRVAAALAEDFDANVVTLSGPDELQVEAIEKLAPSHIFFLHWSWKIPSHIYEAWECIVFHMTDLPFGRGGSPLQNLIERGLKSTKLTALRCVEQMDAGDIYLQEELNLDGTAEQIFARAAALMPLMIHRICADGIKPIPQQGEIVEFKRRKPEQSELPLDLTASAAYDHIRMLDADGYPPAFIRHGNVIIELSNASVEEGRIFASASIRFVTDSKP
jgi:methionyl-tRNA formyltransferase